MANEQALQAGKQLLAGTAGQIEVALDLPADAPVMAGLVCHPNPLQGGSMDNKVVTSLSRMFKRAGGAALRFNFRGVGNTAGVHGQGLGEVDDAVWLARTLRAQVGGKFWLAGFSFGSMVAAHAAVTLAEQGEPVDALLLVAPPVHLYQWPSLDAAGCPVTIIQGEQDDIVDVNEVEAFVGKQREKVAIIRLPQCGHFFHGQLDALADAARSSLP